MNQEAAYRTDWELEGCPGDYTTWLEQKLQERDQRVASVERALWERAGVAADGNPQQQQAIYGFWIAIGAEHKDLDRCQACHGARGGVPGNENIVAGVILCDYCSAERMSQPARAA